MEAYKVVEKNTRNCSNWTLFKGYSKYHPDIYKKGLKFKKEHPEYFPRYLKGRVIKEAKGSAGILCFKSIYSAELFKNSYNKLRENAIIIKVKGKNKKQVYSGLLRGCCGAEGMFKINEEPESWDSMTPAMGCIAFKSVEVLE